MITSNSSALDRVVVTIKNLLHEGGTASRMAGEYGESVRRILLARGLPALVPGAIEVLDQFARFLERRFVLAKERAGERFDELLGGNECLPSVVVLAGIVVEMRELVPALARMAGVRLGPSAS